MKSVLTAGVFLLVSCVVMSHAYDSPPSKILVQRPGKPANFGEFGVAMDNREAVVMTCSAEGTPKPTYRWEFKGGALPEDPRISVEDGVLTIEAPTIDVQGDYQCFASNTYGTALSPKYNLVYAFQANYVAVGKQFDALVEGESGILECGPPDGAPKPRIYWTDVGTKAVDEDARVRMSADGNLHFANVVEGDAGPYYCFAANEFLGNFMRSPLHQVSVTPQEVVNVSPTITLPSNVEGLRTQEFKIQCLAAGFPTPEISWFKNDIELPGNSDRVSVESFNQELVFLSLGFEDAGQYECRAVNSNDSPTTKTVHLTVESAPYFIESPEDLILAPHEQGEIRCSPGGVPIPSSKWLQNGMEIDSWGSVYVLNTEGNAISIMDPQDGDSTVFQCILENEHGQRVGSYTITILAVPATISEAPAARSVVSEEETLTLKCVSFGSPTPEIEWYKDDTKLVNGSMRTSISSEHTTDESKDYKGVISYLKITELVYEDGGTYECRSLNSEGNDAAESVITVRLPTIATMEPAELSVVRGNHADFTCMLVLDERGTAEMTWYFNDAKIHPNKRGSEYSIPSENTLRILSAKSSHTGTFKCTAETDYDSSSSTGELTVQAEPDAPFNVVLDIQGLEATLSWTQPADNNAEILSYIIEYRTQYSTFPFHSDMAPWAELREVSASSSRETITLGNHLEYSFRVTATNDVGTSNKSPLQQGAMTPVAPPDEDSKPESVKSEGSEPGKLRVSWNPVHPFHHNGPDFEYVIRWRTDGGDWQEETISDWRTNSTDIIAGDYEEIEYTIGVRNQVDDGPEPSRETGTTGEGTPDAVPSNVQLVAISSNEINVTWDEINEDEINGAIKSINIYYTVQSGQNSEKVQKCPPEETSCVLGNLDAFTTYEVAVAVENGFAEGERSLPQTIKTDEGVPTAAVIEKVESTSYRLGITWDRPVMENGIHIGYHLSIAEYDDDDAITNRYNETIESPDKLSYKMEEDVKPDTKYEVTLTAYTRVGDSPSEKRDTTTGAAGAPKSPGKPKLIESGKDFINLTWNDVPAKNPKPDYVRACYKTEEEESCHYTDKVDVLDSDRIVIEGLEEGTKYLVYLEFSNKEGTANGDQDTITTENVDKAGKTSGEAALAPFFIALICIIILLLLIILIVCILKSQKGGKYNVSDKEKQLKDENAPLKNNDGFAEFNQDSEFPDDVDGSQDSLASRPEGSEGDSLKEYADDEDPSKFNEEGSFIEEYHDPKTRSTDQRDGGTSTFV